MTAPRPTSTMVHLTPAQMRRIEAAGWRPGTVALGEWLTQRSEVFANGPTDEYREHIRSLIVTAWAKDDG